MPAGEKGLRLADHDADPRPARAGKPPPHQLPHDGPLLGHSGGLETRLHRAAGWAAGMEWPSGWTKPVASNFDSSSLCVKDGVPADDYSSLGMERASVSAQTPCSPGEATTRFDFA